MLEESRDFIWGLILQTQENWTRHGALSRKHFSFRIRLQQFYAPYGRSNAKESLNWPKRDYFYGSHWSLPPKGNESQNKWSNENTGTPSYAEWTPELKNRKGWYVPNQFGWLMNSSFGPSPALSALELEKNCNFKSTKTHYLLFQKWQKINFCTRKKFENCIFGSFNLFSGAKNWFLPFWK